MIILHNNFFDSFSQITKSLMCFIQVNLILIYVVLISIFANNV
jgi:hypothetical protein